jgi:hypothetical protein
LPELANKATFVGIAICQDGEIADAPYLRFEIVDCKNRPFTGKKPIFRNQGSLYDQRVKTWFQCILMERHSGSAYTDQLDYFCSMNQQPTRKKLDKFTGTLQRFR